MKTLYLDITSGISGDMFLGALLDLGVDFQILREDLRKLPVDGWHMHAAKKEKCGIVGTKFDVHIESGEGHHHHDLETATQDSHGHGHHGPEAFDSRGAHHADPAHAHGAATHAHGPHRAFREIRQLIEASPYSKWVKDRAVSVFARIARAEGKVHGKPVDEVHFHEVGALDSILDIIGGCLALEMLGQPVVAAGWVVEGTGWVDCAHGRFPVPAPATLEILGERGVAVSQCDEPHELITPTGAALLAEFAVSFGPMQGLVPSRIAYGLGTRDNRTRPNVLRVVLGENAAAAGAAAAHDWETDQIAVLETNLDDVSSEILGHFTTAALGAGALDVFHTPIQMKKNRPGVLLTVLCAPAEADRFTVMLLRETTAFGVRRQIMERRKLRRECRAVETGFGPISVKSGFLDGRRVQLAPEYESCRAAAEMAGVPLKEVYAAAVKTAENAA
jgi:pyridinium-3,5-bisthiocarboxylic acid mononucleotide nickel chelatase